MGVHVYFAGGLVIGLKYILVLLICFLHHDILLCLDRVSVHRFKLTPLHLVLGRGELPLTLNLIHLCHDLPAESLTKLIMQCLHGYSLDG